MKPYFKVAYNLIRLSFKRIYVKNLEFHKIEMFSKNTKMQFNKNSSVKIGKNVISDGDNTFFVDNNANLLIGDNVYFNERTVISCKRKISIGNNCLFGPDVKLYDNNHKFYANAGVSGNEYSCDDIQIGDNCWIGANVIILKGTKIDNNTIIGAGCIVQGEIPKNSVVTSKREINISPIKG